MSRTITNGMKNASGFLAMLLSRSTLLLIAGCGAAVVLNLGAALIVGIWIGRIAVSFPQNSTANGLSDLSGDVQLKIEEDANQSPRIASYSGILPGFLELGATTANVDLNAGTVTGTLTEPSGATTSLADLLPGLQASRDAGTTSKGSALSLVLQFTSGNTTYIYEMSLNVDADGSRTNLTGEVTVRRKTIQNGIVLLDETGRGTVTAGQGTESQFHQTMPPLPPPIRADVGPDVTIDAGASVILQGSATGGSEALFFSWSPTTGLDDPHALQPTASPSVTTVYRLTVTDARGQKAQDDVSVIVPGTIPDSSSIVVYAGEDVSIPSVGPAKLEAHVSGGMGTLTYSWEPITGLDDPTILQPTASPSATTIYRLTVTDSHGRQAYDDVNVVVLAPPDKNVLDISAYYNGTRIKSLNLTSNTGADWVRAGAISMSDGVFYGVMVTVGGNPSYDLQILFDGPSDAIGSISASAINGAVLMLYLLDSSANPATLAAVYDNSDVFVPLGNPHVDTPIGTIDLRSVNGRIVGTFDVAMSYQPEGAHQPNTLRWVGEINLPDNFNIVGDLIFLMDP